MEVSEDNLTDAPNMDSTGIIIALDKALKTQETYDVGMVNDERIQPE